ncbi:MAG: DNA-protecting protein DprA, partial [Thermoplasmata archaeon]|nr:DNA-protecting protein DprA [Thermoplasmata archaeon]
VSGLARGVDTAAHTAAIEADGTTIAVLGTPLSRTYPAENAVLQRRIRLDHLAVSQFSEQDPILPGNFVIRNRTMALIADASVIVESAEGGGSLNQGWETLRLGRPLFIHDREFEKRELEWPGKMARYGAIRFREPEDIMNYIPSPLPSADVAVAVLEAT